MRRANKQQLEVGFFEHMPDRPPETPVASIAIWVTPAATSQSRSSTSRPVKVANFRISCARAMGLVVPLAPWVVIMVLPLWVLVLSVVLCRANQWSRPRAIGGRVNGHGAGASPDVGGQLTHATPCDRTPRIGRVAAGRPTPSRDSQALPTRSDHRPLFVTWEEPRGPALRTPGLSGSPHRRIQANPAP